MYRADISFSISAFIQHLATTRLDMCTQTLAAAFNDLTGLAGGLLPVSQLGLTAQQTALQGLEFVLLQLHQSAQLSGRTPRYRCHSATSNPAQVEAHPTLLGLFGCVEGWTDGGWIWRETGEENIYNKCRHLAANRDGDKLIYSEYTANYIISTDNGPGAWWGELRFHK